MEKQLVRRMRSYRNTDAHFIVIRDQDSGDCHAIKARLQQFCIAAGRPNAIIIRIACRELKVFYLADLIAVEQGLGVTGIAKRQTHHKFRTPDRLGSPSQELQKLTSGALSENQWITRDWVLSQHRALPVPTVSKYWLKPYEEQLPKSKVISKR